MLELPKIACPIVPINLSNGKTVFMKREDTIDPEISGNKYWKLYIPINDYLKKKPSTPMLITFGGAFSNHIAATAAVGRMMKIPTIGVIRGEELKDNWMQNPTLYHANKNGMQFIFVTRQQYQDKEYISDQLHLEFPNACIIPEGGTQKSAVIGIQYMLSYETKEFDYLCTPVGSGGTVAGIAAYAESDQHILGLKVVKDNGLKEKIKSWSPDQNISLIDASFGGYGKISDEIIYFINNFKQKHQIPLDPIYTGKMMMKIDQLLEENYFPKNAKILCFHTGGLQGILGANVFLKKHNRTLIKE